MTSPVPPVSATYTVTDGDGDTATATIDFQVVDANFPTPGTAAAAVDDDGLAGGNPASTTGDLDANVGDLDGAASSEATFSGVLGGSVGVDGAGSNGFSFAGLNGQAGTVGQENVTYSWTAGSNTLTATTVGGTRPGTALFTVQVTNAATGAYTVTLLDNVLHAQGPNDENDATAALQYSITDADGSTVNGTLTVTFDDDAPTATAEASQNVAEGATVTGTLDFAGGADGATVTHIGLTALVFNPADCQLLAGDRHRRRLHQGEGRRQLLVHRRQSGLGPGVHHLHGDGRRRRHGAGDDQLRRRRRQRRRRPARRRLRSTTTGLPAAIRRARPATSTTMRDGDNKRGDVLRHARRQRRRPTAPARTASPSPASNGQSGTVGQENVTYSWTAGSSTLTATTVGGTRPGTALFTVQVTDAATGAYTVTLLDNVLHALGPNDENDATAALQYSITDADGSTVNGTLTVTFDDDAPTANPSGGSGSVTFANTNLVINLGIPGSMGTADGPGGMTRLETAKAAILESLEQYDALGNVKVELVTFSVFKQPMYPVASWISPRRRPLS